MEKNKEYIISEMIEFCNENSFVNFSYLLRYAKVRRREDWFKLLCDDPLSVFIMVEYLKDSGRGK